MNKKNDNELLEIPDFLKKLSTDEKDEVRPKIEQPDTTKITPLTEFKEEPKNFRVQELAECPKCGKKLTAKTLKYSHEKVCPKNEKKK